MFCVLVGLVPPDEALAQTIRSRVTTLAVGGAEEEGDATTTPIHWKSSYSLATDNDKEGRDRTLLLTAVGDDPATPETVVNAVEAFVAQQRTRDSSTPPAASVELWASAGAPLPLRPLEGYEHHILLNDTSSSRNDTSIGNHDLEQPPPTEKAVRAMQEWGLVVQPQLVSPASLPEIRRFVEDAIAHVEGQLAKHRPHLVIGEDTFCYREIASRNRHRFDLRLSTESIVGDLVRDLLVESDPVDCHNRTLDGTLNIPSFLRTAMDLPSRTDTSPTSHRSSLAEWIDFDLSVVYSRPGAGAQGWHADGQHTPGARDAGWDILGDDNNNNTLDSNAHRPSRLSPPYAICVFVPLIDLGGEDDTGSGDDGNRNNPSKRGVGYTQFWPGSHAHRELVGLGPVARVTQSVWNSNCCRAGDGVWYDYRLMHQGMPNTSENTMRPVLQIIFKRRWYVEKANYSTESIVPNDTTGKAQAQ